MNYLKLFLSLVLLSHFSVAQEYTFNGAAVSTNSVSSGNFGAIIFDGSGLGFGSLSVTPGDISSGSIYNGFSPVFTNTVDAAFFPGSSNSFFTGAAFDKGLGFDVGDAFGVVVFESISSTVTQGTAYQVFTDSSWVLPSDTGVFSFGNGTTDNFTPQTSAAFSGAVGAVPEPSTYAAIAGFFIMGFICFRRVRARRS